MLLDASQIRSGVAQVGAVGPEGRAVLVGGLLVVCAVVLAVDVLRGGHGEAEGGEDIDLSHPSDWRTVPLLVAAFLANVVLIEPVGWWFSRRGAVLGLRVRAGQPPLRPRRRDRVRACRS